VRLAKFLRSEKEAILEEWEQFAVTLLPAAGHLSALALRDHAPQILEAVALDLSTPQTAWEQSEKSKGRAPQLGAPQTAAQTHAVLRAQHGFNIRQLAAEYRALRASVLRLWTERCHPEAIHAGDVMRFNEAIDQALAESIEYFTAQVDQSRNLLLGMLGHDMRTPLNAVLLTANYLAKLNAGAPVSEAADRLIRCGAAIKALLDDLVDFNRTNLGVGIVIRRTDADLAAGIEAEVDLQRHAHSGSRIDLQMTGDLRGHWDVPRLQQVLRNLLSNAIQHGEAGTPVSVKITGREAEVEFEVRNSGPLIAESASTDIFHPLCRGEAGDPDDTGSLGLGLFIVREIALAHGGNVEMRSADGTTVFSVRLAREPQSGPAGFGGALGEKSPPRKQ
jgi:signal transduction histidine kinase